MIKSILILTMMFILYEGHSQCDTTLIKTKHDQFDKSILNTAKIEFQNEEYECFEIRVGYYSTPYTRSGKVTPTISISGRLFESEDTSNTVGDYPYIHFIFEDNTLIQLFGEKHNTYKFQSIIWLKPFHKKSRKRRIVLKALKSKKLKAIRFNKTTKNFDFYLTDSQKIEMQNIFKCITKTDL